MAGKFPTKILATHKCFTGCSCAEAELPELAGPDRPWRAINLTSIATFAAKVFVRSVVVTTRLAVNAYDNATPPCVTAHLRDLMTALSYPGLMPRWGAR